MSTHLSESLNSSRWAEKIRQLRKEKGWSQADLADRLGVGTQAISKTERGTSHFTLERLNRILEALGYEGSVLLEESTSETRADWGPIYATDPDVRRHIRVGRQLAEDLAGALYSTFKVNAVFCFGSLVERQGANARTTSDVDLLVEGLSASRLFEAKSTLEINVVDEDERYSTFTFDVIRNESFQKDTDTMLREGDAVKIPRE
jgi:transcriptional regulator with XRE-family HTH domain